MFYQEMGVPTPRTFSARICQFIITDKTPIKQIYRIYTVVKKNTDTKKNPQYK